jgi:hypothetical protein
VSVRQVEQCHGRDAELRGGCRQFVTPDLGKPLAEAERAGLAVADTQHMNRTALGEEGGEQSAETEALVVGVRHGCRDSRPSSSTRSMPCT